MENAFQCRNIADCGMMAKVTSDGADPGGLHAREQTFVACARTAYADANSNGRRRAGRPD